jgi:hypothetical protein
MLLVQVTYYLRGTATNCAEYSVADRAELETAFETERLELPMYTTCDSLTMICSEVDFAASASKSS